MRLMCRLAFLWARLPNPHYLEVFSGATAVEWGVALLLHPDVLRTSRLYAALEAAAPWPHAVGGAAVLIGLTQILIFFAGREMGRWFAAFVAGTFYVTVLIAVRRVDETMPGPVMYASFAGMNLLAMALVFRRKKEA